MAEDTSTVQFRDIKSYPGYRVGSDGSVWSCWKWFRGNGREKKNHMTGTWHRQTLCMRGLYYLGVDLNRIDHNGSTRCSVHLLVLEAFVGPRPPGMQCRHFPDRDTKNNRLENLSWGTCSQNMADKIVHGTSQHGERNHQHKVTADIVRDIRAKCAAGNTHQTLADRYHISRASVGDIVNKRTWAQVA